MAGFAQVPAFAPLLIKADSRDRARESTAIHSSFTRALAAPRINRCGWRMSAESHMVTSHWMCVHRFEPSPAAPSAHAGAPPTEPSFCCTWQALGEHRKVQS